MHASYKATSKLGSSPRKTIWTSESNSPITGSPQVKNVSKDYNITEIPTKNLVWRWRNWLMWFTLASFLGKRNSSKSMYYSTKSHLWGNIISHSNPEVVKFWCSLEILINTTYNTVLCYSIIHICHITKCISEIRCAFYTAPKFMMCIYTMPPF
jgi:hypothetical protein